MNNFRLIKNLELLYLSDTNVKEIPREVEKLRKLRSLCAGGWRDYSNNVATRGVKVPNGIGKLLSLEVLGIIEVDDDTIVREIGKLTNLTDLIITKLRSEDGKEFISSLVKLNNLQKLSITSVNGNETLEVHHLLSPTPKFLESLELEGHLERIPHWTMSLQSLTTLRLTNSGLREDYTKGGIDSLQHLPNLLSLSLVLAYVGETLCFKVGGFQKLKTLQLGNLERLKRLCIEEGSMPSLENLCMVGCQRVVELPLGIQNLIKLKYILLHAMSNQLIEKVTNSDKQSEECQTIARIPEVCITYLENGNWHKYPLKD